MKGSGLVPWLFYLAVRSVFAIVQIFPLAWNLHTARILARIWRRIMPRHYERAVTHLTLAIGDELDEQQIRTLAHQCLESVTMFAIEVICLPRLIRTLTLSRYVRVVDFEETLRLLLSGKGLIMVTGHYGSFELLGHLLAALGFDVAAIMRPLDNVYLNRFVVASRRTHGLKVLDKKGAMQSAEGLLRDGAALGFIGDQDAGRKGLFVDFFGQPASTYKSIALLAATTHSPIAVGYARRLGVRPLYEVGVQRVIHPHEWQDKDDPIRWITQEYTAAIEATVRAEPSQYLWIHRRWKSQPRPRKP